MFERDSERGQVGIGTLIVFIAMVLVAAIAAGVLINTAGFLQSKSEQTGEQSSQQVTNRLDVVTVTGSTITNGTYGEETGGPVVLGDADVTSGTNTKDLEQIQSINLSVKKAPGANDINLDNVTIQFNGPDGVRTLTSSNVGDAADDFNVTVIKDADDSNPVVNGPDDRLDLGINMTFVNGADTNYLQEGETATLTITTQSGASTEVRVEVPQSLSGETAVEL